MLIDQQLDVRGDEIKLTNTFNTDDLEKFNWETKKENGKGFMRDDKGNLKGRHVAQIPIEEAAYLRAICDIDFIQFEQSDDEQAKKRALSRLLKHHPHWKVCDGGV